METSLNVAAAPAVIAPVGLAALPAGKDALIAESVQTLPEDPMIPINR